METLAEASGLSDVCAATIKQAVDDLKLMGRPEAWRRGNQANTSYHARLRDFESAVAFFHDPASNFQWMCEACNVDPDVALEKVEPLLQEAIRVGTAEGVLG